MIALQIIDIKNFMTHFLLQETFDSFLLQQAKILTGSQMVLQGKRNPAWYDTEELDSKKNLPDFGEMTWGELRGMVFYYIKGNRPPQKMWIDLKASAAQTEHFFKDASLAMPALLPSFHVQICYEKESLRMVTGVSYGEFTSDKTGQQLWDTALCRFLKKEKIVFDLINPE